MSQIILKPLATSDPGELACPDMLHQLIEPAPDEEGLGDRIDVRSWVTLIVFLCVNALVIHPVEIPLPLFFPRAYHYIKSRGKSPWNESDQSNGTGNGSGNGAGNGTLDQVANPPLQNNNDTDNSGVIGTTQVQSFPAVNSNGNGKQKVKPKPWVITLGLKTAPVTGVLLLLATTCIDGGVVRRGIVGRGDMKPYDIMTLFTSFAYISISLDHTGLFRYLAFVVAQRYASTGSRLFFAFYAFFAATGIIFGNDPLILSGTPFLAYFTQHAAIPDPAAYLFSHFQISNLVSALLVASNPTNLVITSVFNISFLKYSAWTSLPVVTSIFVLFPLLRWGVFRKKGMIPKVLHPPKDDPRRALLDPAGGVFGATLFVSVIIILVVLSTTGQFNNATGVWTVTAPAAIIMLVRDMIHDWRSGRRPGEPPEHMRHNSVNSFADPATLDFSMPSIQPFNYFARRFPGTWLTLVHMPFPLVVFGFSMFTLMEGLLKNGWINIFAQWWHSWAQLTGVAGSIALMGLLTVMMCNLCGTNIGATVLLTHILQQWQRNEGRPSERQLYGAIFAIAVGSSFGAYSFSFPASLAGLLWTHLLKRKGIIIKHWDFVRWNIVSIIVTMITGCLVVAAEVCVIFQS